MYWITSFQLASLTCDACFPATTRAAKISKFSPQAKPSTTQRVATAKPDRNDDVGKDLFVTPLVFPGQVTQIQAWPPL